MSCTRRRFVLALAAAPLLACTSDPTISDADSLGKTAEPVQEPSITALAAALARLQATIQDQPEPYRSAATAQLAAWQERLAAVDPVAGGEPRFPVPTGQPGELAEVVSAVQASAEAARLEAGSQPLRLLLLSVQLGAAGLGNAATEPSASEVTPGPYPEVTVAAAQGVALTHVWATIQALERGIGLLQAEETEAIRARLAELKRLRDELTAILGEDRPTQDLHYELPPISDAASLNAAWSQQELRLMAAAAGVAAAGEASWASRALAGVVIVHSLGGKLPTWPGWATN